LNLLINSYELDKTVTLLELFIIQHLTVGRRYRLAVSIKFIS